MSDFLDKEQSLTDHLTELRVRLIRAIFWILLFTCLGWYFSDIIMDVVRYPIQQYLPEGGLVYTGVMDKFMAHVKLGMLAGVILSAPFWLFEVWKFVAPGLYQKEKRYAASFILAGTLLFLTGVAFVYFLVYPVAFEWLMSFGGTTDKPMITIDDYLSFFITTALLFGASFELPLILIVLVLIGLLDVNFLRTKRRYAVVALAVVAAILTPPDVISMTMMLVPLCLLYESAIIVLVLMGHGKKT